MNSRFQDTGSTSQRMRCLIVDDLDENLLALTALLRRDDIEVLQARSGAEALELLLTYPDVALAFLDVQMPEMDGFELAELMRGSERTQRIPIIFVTAGAVDQHRQFKGYEMGAVDFLHKPVPGHVLRSKAEAFFELFRQRRQLETQLAELKEILRLNEMFTAVLGHDLRGPLNVILMATTMLQISVPDAQAQQNVARIDSNVRRMGRMIEDLLDLARTRLAGGIPIKREHVDAGQLLHALVQEQRAAQPARVIEFEAQGDLGGKWDSDRLSQLAGNLIGNALLHGAPGSPVTVRLDGTIENRVLLSVCNQGTISAELLPRIFDPFRLGQRELRSGEGLGLGLYIVQKIAEAHDGRVEVTTGENDSTTFVVQLPRIAHEVLRL